MNKTADDVRVAQLEKKVGRQTMMIELLKKARVGTKKGSDFVRLMQDQESPSMWIKYPMVMILSVAPYSSSSWYGIS